MTERHEVWRPSVAKDNKKCERGKRKSSGQSRDAFQDSWSSSFVIKYSYRVTQATDVHAGPARSERRGGKEPKTRKSTSQKKNSQEKKRKSEQKQDRWHSADDIK